MKSNYWNIEMIKAGIDRFITEYGRPPRAVEWDSIEYLPSARTVQRTYGGLERLRAQLGYLDHHYGKGIYRTRIANSVNARGAEGERYLKDNLIALFGEEFVHEQKMLIEKSKKRIDFYVYTPDGNFAVDVFACETLHDFTGNINHKLSVYGSYMGKLFFVLFSQSLTENDIANTLRTKKKLVGPNVTIVSSVVFLNELKGRRRYHALVKQIE